MAPAESHEAKGPPDDGACPVSGSPNTGSRVAGAVSLNGVDVGTTSSPGVAVAGADGNSHASAAIVYRHACRSDIDAHRHSGGNRYTYLSTHVGPRDRNTRRRRCSNVYAV